MSLPIYLLLLAVFVAVFFTAHNWIMTAGVSYNGSWKEALVICIASITSIISLVWIIIGLAVPIGDFKVETRPATSIRVGDIIVVKASGWPPQQTDEIQFLDKTCVVNETSMYSVWGYSLGKTYNVRLAK